MADWDVSISRWKRTVAERFPAACGRGHPWAQQDLNALVFKKKWLAWHCFKPFSAMK
jgi:hypothetical protein